MMKFNLFFLMFFSVTCLSQKAIKIGVVPFKTDEKVLGTYEPIMNALASELGTTAKVNLVQSTDLAYYLDKGQYDLGVFTVFPYLKQKHDFPKLEVFASDQIKGRDAFEGAILVNKGSAINGINDLKGKKLLFVKPTSTSGFKYPKGILAEYDIDIEEELEYDFAGGHIEAIWALKNKDCDAIAVDATRFSKIDSLSKEDFKELVSFDVPHHAYVLSPKLSEKRKGEIVSHLKDAHVNPEWKHLWENPLGIEKFLLKKDDYYNPIRRYLSIIRVKPTVKISVNASENAQDALKDGGDLLNILNQRTKRHIAESKRFSSQPSENVNYDMQINLSHAGKEYHYQIDINGELITDGDVPDDSLSIVVPLVAAESLLKTGKIETKLLTNGEKWFITYGLKDGLNKEDYTFEYLTDNNEKMILTGNDLVAMNEMTIQFKEDPSFRPNMPLTINYIKEAHEIPVVKKGRVYNVFRKEFYQQKFMDMALALLGTFFGICVFLFSTVFTRRKKKRFKSILYDTNNLIKKFVEGKYEMETKLIEQRESIRMALESGHINENQYIILKHRLEELESLIDKRTGELPITEQEASAISDIVKDGIVSEKEYTQIMRILHKRK